MRALSHLGIPIKILTRRKEGFLRKYRNFREISLTALLFRLQLPDAGAGLEDVEVLEDVGDRHQPQGAEEPQPDPVAVQVDRDEGGRDGEVVHEGEQLQHEPELVRGGYELRKHIR